ncbi:DNA internalization-related competence protein ComEC/Rec2 [Lactobacillaceae bacterium L1_55_11]|nr:DNA internalization-related competence protein ComEC/Rec2 [Lactobacillaceae bacterium L1_55_11]
MTIGKVPLPRLVLLASFLAASLSGVIFRPNLYTYLLLGMAVGLILWQRSGRALGLTVVVVLPFALSFGIQRLAQDRLSGQPSQLAQVFAGRIYPDDIQIDGDQFKARGQLDSGERVQIFWKIAHHQQLTALMQNTRTLAFRAQGDLKPVSPPTNFNQFDNQQYLKTQGICRQLTARKLQWTGDVGRGWLDHLKVQLRDWHAVGLQNCQHLPKPLSYYTQALLLGDNVPELYQENPGISQLGLIHLFSVSGFQLNLLIAVVMAICKRLGLWYEVVAAGLIGILPLYFLYSGSPPILVRSLISSEILLLMAIFGRRRDGVLVWSLSLLVSLAVAPQILLTLGGQLSFALTFALLFTNKLKRWQRDIWLALISLPLILTCQYTWHILQLGANILAIPIFELLVVPLVGIGFVGQGCPGVTPLTNQLLHVFASSLDRVAQLPGLLVVGKLPGLVLLLMFISTWLFWVPKRRLKRAAVSLWLLSLSLGWFWVHWPSHGEFTTFDIGQGDAALVRTPFNRSVTLIDTGGLVDFSRTAAWQKPEHRSNPGETVVVNYLHSLGLNRVDNLVLSHRDQDHIGYVPVILTKLQVKRLIMPAGMAKQNAYLKKIAPYLGKTQVLEVTNQTKVPNFPLEILHPFAPGEAENQDSIALYGRLGNHNIFTAGDLDQGGELAVAAAYPSLKVDILKLGHHGSKTSTAPAILDRWQVKIGLVSAGRNNRYHHPNDEVIERLKEHRVTILNTQHNGMLRYIYDRHYGYFEVKVPDEPKTAKRTN